MSTLTKVLIVLLTLSSIFLCGIVITFVASSKNYKLAFENQIAALEAAKAEFKTKSNLAEAQIAKAQEAVDEANKQITRIEAEKAQLQVDLDSAKRAGYGSQERLTNMAGVVTSLNQTIASMDESLKLAREELDKLRNEQIKDRKNLNEITAAMNERTVRLEALESERRRLLEEKTNLESRIAKISGGVAGTVSTSAAVTPEKNGVKIAAPPENGIVLQGRVEETNLQNKLITISLGSADGVLKGMRFHVVRGDAFVCDAIVTNVDEEKSAAAIELVEQQPEIGDTVTTKF